MKKRSTDMITATPTEHLNGIMLEGEYDDFSELVDCICLGCVMTSDTHIRETDMSNWWIVELMRNL